jgi:hypothetical protein
LGEYVLDAAGPTVPPLIAIGVTWLLLPVSGVQPFVATVAGEAFARAMLLILAVLLVSILAARWLNARLGREDLEGTLTGLLRHSAGALIVGLVLAVAVPVYLFYGAKQGQSALALAEDQVNRQVLDSLKERHSTGAFPQPERQPGPLQTTANISESEQRAEYTTRASGVPGRLVANVEPEKAELRWERSEDSTNPEIRAAFVVGKVERREPGRIDVTDSTGKKQEIRLSGNETPPAQDSQVAVAFNPKTRALLKWEGLGEQETKKSAPATPGKRPN